ncbi:MAG: hypothetical protein ACYTF6_14525 [Planctomycetota bacterium]
MAKSVGSIAELTKLLAQKQKQLAKLAATRKKLVAQLEKVDARMAAVKGARVARGRPRAGAKRRRGRPRGPRQKKTLKQAVAEILDGSRKPLGAKDIAAALPGAGYVSKSQNLLTMIGSVLSRTPEFRRVSRGKYRLQRRRGRKPGAAKGRAKARPASQTQG